MDGSPAETRWTLDSVPVPALLVRGRLILAANAAAAALLGLGGAFPQPLEDVFGADFEIEGEAAREVDVDRGRGRHSRIEVRSGACAGDGSRVLALRDVSVESATRRRLERGLEFERLLTRSSAELMRSGEDRLDDAIVDALGAVGGFFGVDRAYVFLIDDEAGTQSNTHEWVAAGISRESSNLQDVPLDAFPWLLSRLRTDAPFCFESIGDLPPEAGNERAELEREGIQSILVVPLWASGALRGFVGFDAVRSRVEWDEPYVIGLRLLAQMLGGALDARAMAHRLRRQAMHDAVTGLPNRLYLRDRFDRGVRPLPASARANAFVAVIDVDDFKIVNDRFGHACGDALLRELGRRLEAAVGDEGVVARIGGDEFVAVQPRERGTAESLAARLLGASTRPFDLGGDTHFIGLSIGLVQGVEAQDDLDTILHRADAAMYRAKAAGKNGWSMAAAPGNAPSD